MSSLRVTAVMAVYNPNHLVIEAIRSVLTQSRRPDEFLIINDGGPEDYIRSVLPDDPIIRYHYQENKGVTGARNQAISLATGDFIGFLDQDDFWNPDKLECQLNLVEGPSDICMIVSPITIINEQSKILSVSEEKWVQYKQQAASGNPFSSLLKGNYIFSSTPLIHRDLFIRLGGFEKRFEPHDDWAMYLKIAYAGFPIRFFSDHALSVWRKHASNESSNLRKMLRSKSRVERFYLRVVEKPEDRKIVSAVHSFTNLDRVNAILYRKNMVQYCRLLPVFLYRFFKYHKAEKIEGLKNRDDLFLKSIKRWVISVSYFLMRKRK